MTAAGTLTFLFADLRDYTAFVEAHGDAAGTELIAEYRRLIRGEVAKAGEALGQEEPGIIRQPLWDPESSLD